MLACPQDIFFHNETNCSIENDRDEYQNLLLDSNSAFLHNTLAAEYNTTRHNNKNQLLIDNDADFKSKSTTLNDSTAVNNSLKDKEEVKKSAVIYYILVFYSYYCHASFSKFGHRMSSQLLSKVFILMLTQDRFQKRLMKFHFIVALESIPKLGRRKILVNGKPCGKNLKKYLELSERFTKFNNPLTPNFNKLLGRNELISDYIFRKTCKIRTRKQVSSHIQVLKNTRKGDAHCMY